jgi:tetratricopeptide (TPR) repeat protein
LKPLGISLVVLACDEEPLLSPLLSHHRPLYDEALVVLRDPGRGSGAAAAAAGARVVPFSWCDDFAAARNSGLNEAHGSWILVLDTDERVAERDFPKITECVTDVLTDYYICDQRNYTNRRTHPDWQPVDGQYAAEESGQIGYVATQQARLFPNLPELRYRGCIHESVDADARRLGLRPQILPVVIHHYGHVQPEPVQQRRDELYARLTRRKWQEAPDDAAAGLEMATRLIEEGRRHAAVVLLKRLLQGSGEDVPVTRARLLLAWLLRHEGDTERACKLAQDALQRQPGWLQAWLELIRSLMTAERWTEAGRSLRQACRLFGPEPRLILEECRYLIGTGRADEALHRAEDLARRCPTWSEARILAGSGRKKEPMASARR